MRTYILGQTIRLSAQLFDDKDVAIDPTGMRLLLFGPTDSVAQIIGATVDPGDETTLYAEVSPSVAGVWRYRWEVPSGTKAADERSFTVVARTVPGP